MRIVAYKKFSCEQWESTRRNKSKDIFLSCRLATGAESVRPKKFTSMQLRSQLNFQCQNEIKV